MKFTIRDLFLVTLVVAILVAWWGDRNRMAGEIVELKEEITTLRDSRPRPTIRIPLDLSKFAQPLPTSSAPAPNPPKP